MGDLSFYINSLKIISNLKHSGKIEDKKCSLLYASWGFDTFKYLYSAVGISQQSAS